MTPYLARFIRRDASFAPPRRFDVLRKLQLKFWLRCMEACEKSGRSDSPVYYWVARRAMLCNPWRKKWN